MKQIKGFIAGCLFSVLGLTTVLASGGIKSATFNANKIVFNGNVLDISSQQLISVVKDGETNASNYMPVRAVLEAMGYQVDWDGSKNAVIVNSSKNISESNNKPDNSSKSTKRVDRANEYQLVPLYVIGDNKYNGDTSLSIYSHDGKTFIPLALCPILTAICNSDYDIDYSKARASDGQIYFKNTDKYIRMENTPINPRDNRVVYTLYNGYKTIVYDKSNEDESPMISVNDRLCIDAEVLKQELDIYFDYKIDDANGVVVFSNFANN